MKERIIRILLLLCILMAVLPAAMGETAAAAPPCVARGHSWGDWTVDWEATCGYDGQKTRYCTVCGEAGEHQAIPATGNHSWGDWYYMDESADQPTCTSPGVQTRWCTVCQEKQTRDVPPLDHTYSDWYIEQEATCTTEGYQVRYCLFCQEEEYGFIPAEGHAWDNGTVTAAATCTSAGVRTYRCIRCGAAYEEAIPASGHSLVTLPAVPAACTAPGLTEGSVCSVCGTVFAAQAEIPALGHVFGDWVLESPANCINFALYRRTCARCGQMDWLRDESALGDHVWDEGTVTREAGLLNEGEKTFTCAVCGQTRTEVIPATFSSLSPGGVSMVLHNLDPDTEPGGQPLTITKQPEGGHITRGLELHSMSVEVEGGTPPYTYQWYSSLNMDTTGLTGWELIVTQLMNAMYSNEPTPDGYQAVYTASEGNRAYYCIVTDRHGDEVKSDKAQVDWELRPVREPQNSVAPARLAYQVADGKKPYSYQWYGYDPETQGPYDAAPLDGGTGGKYLAEDLSLRYFCTVTDAAGESLESDDVMLYAEELKAEPEEETVYLRTGETRGVYVNISGGVPPYTVSWKIDGADYSSGLSAEETGDGGYCSCVYVMEPMDCACDVTDAIGNTASAAVYVNWAPPEVVIQPDGGNIPAGGSFTLRTVVKGGKEPYTYVLLQDGGPYEMHVDDNVFIVTEPGEYCINVFDDNGADVCTDTVTVTKDAGLQVKLEYGEIALPNGPGRLLACIEGGKKPYNVRWERWDDNQKQFLFLQEKLTNEDQWLLIPYYLGNYRCIVKDSVGEEVAVARRVDYIGKLPWITVHPQGSRIDYEPYSPRSVRLDCDAISGSGKDTNLVYMWQKLDSAGWKDLRGGKQLFLNEDRNPTVYSLIDGVYRCSVRDRVTGGVSYSLPAFVSTRMTITAEQEGSSGTFHVKVMGGSVPYTMMIKRTRDKIEFDPDSFRVVGGVIHIKHGCSMDPIYTTEEEIVSLENCRVSMNNKAHEITYDFVDMSTCGKDWDKEATINEAAGSIYNKVYKYFPWTYTFTVFDSLGYSVSAEFQSWY